MRSAIGFDQKRGDQVEIVNLQFAETPAAAGKSEANGWLDMLQFTKDDIMRGIELGVMALLGLIVLLFVVRPLVRRIVTPDALQTAAGGAIADGTDAATDGGTAINTGGGITIVGSDPAVAQISTQTSQMIDIAQVQGQVHAQSVQKVGELADTQSDTRPSPSSVNGCTKPRDRSPWPPHPQTSQNDIASLVASLASRQGETTGQERKLTGPERAAILMLALGEQYGAQDLGSMLDDDELRELSIVMSTLGTVEADVGGRPAARIRRPAVGVRRADGQLRRDRAAAAAISCRPSASAASWTKSAAPPAATCGRSSPTFRKRCSPTTSRTNIRRPSRWCSPSCAPNTPPACSPSCPRNWRSTSSTACCAWKRCRRKSSSASSRRCAPNSCPTSSQTRRRDAHEVMAEIFNNFDRQTETRFLTALEEDNREAAERIKALMFTFDDLVKLDAASAQTLMRHVDKDKLAHRAQGRQRGGAAISSSATCRSRAAKMLVDDMEAMGPVRLRDVDEAQVLLVNLAKDLAAKGEIIITKSRGDEELVY